MKLVILLFFIINFAQSAEITSVNFLQQGEVSQLIISYDGELSYEKSNLKNKKQILLDLQGVNASKETIRSIDTSEFSGSVVYISGFKKKNSLSDIRFLIQLRDNAQSRVKTLEGKIVLEVENRFGAFASSEGIGVPRQIINGTSAIDSSIQITDLENSEDEEELSDILKNLTLAGNKKFYGRKISVNVKNLPLNDLFKMISQVSGFNIVLSEAASGKSLVTLNLTNVPWDEALDIVLKLNKLVAIKRSNILQIETEKQYIADEKAKIEAIKAKKVLDPLKTRIFSINFSSLSDIQNSINSHITKDRGNISLSERTSKIIIKDTEKQLDKISEIISKLDIETPQVLIEAKIVEVSEDSTFQYGLSQGGGAGLQGAFGGRQLGFSTLASASGLLEGESKESVPRLLFNTTGSSFLNFNIVKDSIRLGGILDLLESENKSKVITSPRVVTKDNEAATITSTKQISYKSTRRDGGAETETFETASASLNLNVTPKVSNDGTINLEINVSNGEFGVERSDGAPPDTTSNSVTTKVLVENGSTVVIGGLYKTREGSSSTGVPFLKDIPILGWLFRSAKVQKPSKTELMVFITPRVINKQGKGTELSQVVE